MISPRYRQMKRNLTDGMVFQLSPALCAPMTGPFAPVNPADYKARAKLCTDHVANPRISPEARAAFTALLDEFHRGWK